MIRQGKKPFSTRSQTRLSGSHSQNASSSNQKTATCQGKTPFRCTETRFTQHNKPMHQQESAGSPELLLRPIRGVAISVWTPRMERPLSPVVNLRLQFMLAVSILNISKGLQPYITKHHSGQGVNYHLIINQSLAGRRRRVSRDLMPCAFRKWECC